MDYLEWESLKVGDRVKHFIHGKGTIITDVGVGYVVHFDNGNKARISDGSLKKSKWNSSFKAVWEEINYGVTKVYTE